MAVTVRQVAARAGVSPVVVSRVLHNKAVGVRVSEATAQRVREAAEELGYSCNVMARNFRSRQTQVIGVLHGMGFAPPIFRHGSRYFANLMDGFIEGAFRQGYSITLCPSLLGTRPEDAVGDGRFDGLVWYNAVPSEENHRMLQRVNVPLVIIHAQHQDFEGKVPTVICDNMQGIDLAVQHLEELGHRHIAYVYGGSTISTETHTRRHAFAQSMTCRELPLTDVSYVYVSPDLHELDDFLTSPNRVPTAVISHNEELAGQMVQRAAELGVKVPEDLSIVGFDSTDYCLELRPKLTSIHQPLVAMGEKAIELLINRIRGDVSPPPHVVLPCGLDIRESTTVCNSYR